MKVIPREAGRITYSAKIRDLKKNLSLSDLQKSLVLGSVLGDGNLELNWSKTNYKFRVAHSIKQQEYLLWKYEVLKDWVLQKPYYQKSNNSLSFRTVSHSQITEFAELFYKEGRKIIPDTIEALLSPYAVAIWFMDDGNVIRRKGKIYGYHLNTQSFTLTENLLLLKAFKNLYGIEGLPEINKGKYRLRIMKRESREKFSALVNDNIIQSMKYKIS